MIKSNEKDFLCEEEYTANVLQHLLITNDWCISYCASGSSSLICGKSIHLIVSNWHRDIPRKKE